MAERAHDRALHTDRDGAVTFLQPTPQEYAAAMADLRAYPPTGDQWAADERHHRYARRALGRRIGKDGGR